jgi:Fic family protein
MKLSNEYTQDLQVRMSHHSSVIENNKITLPETVSIIHRELYEIDNHRYKNERIFVGMSEFWITMSENAI